MLQKYDSSVKTMYHAKFGAIIACGVQDVSGRLVQHTGNYVHNINIIEQYCGHYKHHA